MKTFVAIDFETANNHPASVCSVGIVVVVDGIVAGKFYESIRPASNFYNYWNTRIHGLSIKDTTDALEFSQVWQKITGQIAHTVSRHISRIFALQEQILSQEQMPGQMAENLLFVAHNSPFDEGCLRAVYNYYGLDYTSYRFHCTCRLSRKAFPHPPNHKLHTVAEYAGFDFVNHHHALADAEACAAIYLAL